MAGAHAYSSSPGLYLLREPSASFDWSYTSEYDQVPANAIDFQPDLLPLTFPPESYPALSTGGILDTFTTSTQTELYPPLDPDQLFQGLIFSDSLLSPDTHNIDIRSATHTSPVQLHYDLVMLWRQLRDMFDQFFLSVQPLNVTPGNPLSQNSANLADLDRGYQLTNLRTVAGSIAAPESQLFPGSYIQPSAGMPSTIPSVFQSTGGAESLIAETSQTNTSSMQPSASRESISASETSSNGKEHSHRCDSCDKSFRRPYLLQDHKRKCIDEATKVYPCWLEGCTLAYTSKSNLARHVRKSHPHAGNRHSPLPASDGREISAQPPLPGPSTHSMRGSTNMRRSGQGTPSSGNVRFCPYETPDSVRDKLTKRKK